MILLRLGALVRAMNTRTSMIAVRRALLLVIALSSPVAVVPAHAEVREVCRVAFVETGAVPFDDACPLIASTFRATLANYTCGVEEIEEFCSTLTDYDDCVSDGVCQGPGGGPDDDGGTDGDDTAGAGGDDSGSGGDDDGGAGDDDGAGEGSGTDGGTGSDDAQGLGSDDGTFGLDEYDEGADDSGAGAGGTGDEIEVIEGEVDPGDGTYGLEQYDESTGDGSAGDGSGAGAGTGSGETCRGEQAIDWNGNFDFVFGPGLDQLPLPDSVPGYGVAGGVVNGYNIASAAALARETGNYGPMMDVINSTILPFGIAGDEFRDFGDFITVLSGGTVGCR